MRRSGAPAESGPRVWDVMLALEWMVWCNLEIRRELKRRARRAKDHTPPQRSNSVKYELKDVPDVLKVVDSLKGRAVEVFHKREDGSIGPLSIVDVEKFTAWCKSEGIEVSKMGVGHTLKPYGSKPDGDYDLGWHTRAFAGKVAAALGVPLQGI